MFALDFASVKTQKLFSSHVGFLTCAMNQQRNFFVKYETQRGPMLVRAKENLNLSHGGSSNRQASGTKPPMKALCQGCQ